jgi:uncharacterized membrane protein YbhN (UPF0104 family)
MNVEAATTGTLSGAPGTGSGRPPITNQVSGLTSSERMSASIVASVLQQLRRRPIELSVLATLIAALAVVLIARVTEADAVGRAFAHFSPGWIGLIAGAELLAYPAYMWAYRSIASVHGHAPLALPIVARIVVAGFGPFSIGGGFGIDRQALEALHEDEHSARVRVLALGVLEWAVLAPTTCVVSIVFLAEEANILPSLLWPWAVLVPVGFGLGLWASTRPGLGRWLRSGGRVRAWAGHTLEGMGVIRTLILRPRAYAGAWLGTALYWAADIGAFYGGLRTFGLDPGAGKVILAYATGYAATRRSLPLGGAGLTEVLMTYSLYWVRLPLAPALGAVVAYRLFNFLLAAMPGLIAHRQLEPVLRRTR